MKSYAGEILQEVSKETVLIQDDGGEKNVSAPFLHFLLSSVLLFPMTSDFSIYFLRTFPSVIPYHVKHLLHNMLVRLIIKHAIFILASGTCLHISLNNFLEANEGFGASPLIFLLPRIGKSVTLV